MVPLKKLAFFWFSGFGAIIYIEKSAGILQYEGTDPQSVTWNLAFDSIPWANALKVINFLSSLKLAGKEKSDETKNLFHPEICFRIGKSDSKNNPATFSSTTSPDYQGLSFPEIWSKILNIGLGENLREGDWNY